MKGQGLGLWGPVGSRAGEWKSRGHPSFSHPQTKTTAGQWEAAWGRNTSMTACPGLGIWSVRAQEGLMGIRETNSWQHSGSVLQLLSLLGSTPSLEIWTERQALLRFKALGWWRREQAVFCPWVKTPPPAAHSGPNSCPVTPGFAHLGSPLQLNELGRRTHSPDSSQHRGEYQPPSP